MLRETAEPNSSKETPEIAGEPTVLGYAGATGPRDEGVAVLIPLATRVVVTENCGIGLSLGGQAERQIAFDKALQRLRHMCRRLIIVNDAFEPVHRSQILAALKVVPADLHFLTGQMIASKVEFELGVACVLAVGKTTHHVIERLQGLVRYLLIAAYIGDLDIIGNRLQIIGVSNVAVPRMQLDKAIRSNHCFAIISRLVFGIGCHDLALRGPDRVGMLALDLVKGLGRRGITLLDHLVHGRVVEVVDRPWTRWSRSV